MMLLTFNTKNSDMFSYIQIYIFKKKTLKTHEPFYVTSYARIKFSQFSWRHGEALARSIELTPKSRLVQHLAAFKRASSAFSQSEPEIVWYIPPPVNPLYTLQLFVRHLMKFLSGKN